MAYTPINWQTGDTITAEKMNKMDNGWGVESTTVSETIETAVPPIPIPNTPAQGIMNYESPITGQSLTVTFNNTTYVLPGATLDWCNVYGDYDAENDEFDFSTYPLGIMSGFDGAENEVYTETAGTYSISFSVPSLEIGGTFKDAVKLAGEDTFANAEALPYEMALGTATFSDVFNALSSGRLVYIKSHATNTNTWNDFLIISASYNALTVYGIRIVEGNISTVSYSSDSVDGVLQ